MCIFAANLVLNVKELLIVDYLQWSLIKYCDVETLRMAEYEKIRADLVWRMGEYCHTILRY